MMKQTDEFGDINSLIARAESLISNIEEIAKPYLIHQKENQVPLGLQAARLVNSEFWPGIKKMLLAKAKLVRENTI